VEYEELLMEFRRLDATEVVVTSNVPLKRDRSVDWDFAYNRHFDDPGVAVYFKLKGRPQVICCDAWQALNHNLRAITKTIEAMRALPRYGASEIGTRSFTGLNSLPERAESLTRWWEILGVRRDASIETIKEAYRRSARECHPDRNGDPVRWSIVTQAKLDAEAEKGVKF